MGEGSLAVKISKMTNDINLLRTDLETDKKDLNDYKIRNKQSIDSINTSINTLNNKIYETNELITTTKNELTELISTSILEHDKNVTYAIGKPYISFTDSRNPSEILGFGTWEQVKDKTIFGVGDETEFNAVKKTGGSKTHSHDSGTIVANIGAVENDTALLGYSATNWSGTMYNMGVGGTGALTSDNIHICNHSTTTSGNTGVSSNMPPYITAYIWIRIS